MGASLGRVLIVDDEEDLCKLLFVLVKREGFEPVIAHDGETALEMIQRGIPDVVLLDVRMSGIDGFEVLRRTRKINSGLPVLIMTAYGGVNGAVEAMKLGAFDYLTKPIEHQDLLDRLKKALASRPSAKSPLLASAQIQSATPLSLKEIMGPSKAVERIIRDVALVSPSEFTVIIQGETGTGKELVARAVHQTSARAERQMIPVDCGAIPETLFESELFGYEKGAFTGAVTRRAGKFELAHGGTLFLDEITNMPPSSQVKLLRAIQERSFFRVGGKDPLEVNVRLLVASNQDLMTSVSLRAFSRDLFYRLSEFSIVIPPLRERKEDIEHLANRFRETANLELQKEVKGFTNDAVRFLLDHPWPGNVRQLRSTVRRGVLQAGDAVGVEHLGVERPCGEDDTCKVEAGLEVQWEGLSLKEIVRRSTMELERRVLTKALRKTGGNKAEAARLLHIDYKTIHSKVKQLGINMRSEAENESEEKRKDP